MSLVVAALAAQIQLQSLDETHCDVLVNSKAPIVKVEKKKNKPKKVQKEKPFVFKLSFSFSFK